MRTEHSLLPGDSQSPADSQPIECTELHDEFQLHKLLLKGAYRPTYTNIMYAHYKTISYTVCESVAKRVWWWRER